MQHAAPMNSIISRYLSEDYFEEVKLDHNMVEFMTAREIRGILVNVFITHKQKEREVCIEIHLMHAIETSGEAAVAEFLHRINNRDMDGRFILDCDSGMISYRITFTYVESVVNLPEYFASRFEQGMFTVKQCIIPISSVAWNEGTPANAMKLLTLGEGGVC